MKPEDIEKLANAVLSIQLPKSPDEIKDMIEDIKRILANVTDLDDDLEHLEKQARIAEDMKERAQEILWGCSYEVNVSKLYSFYHFIVLMKLNLWTPVSLILFGCCITRNRTKAINVREIEKALNDTANLNDEIFKDLDEVQENNGIIKGKVNEVMVYFPKKTCTFKYIFTHLHVIPDVYGVTFFTFWFVVLLSMHYNLFWDTISTFLPLNCFITIFSHHF